jgi:hypothetical protein
MDQVDQGRQHHNWITESKKNDLRIEVEENIRDWIKEVIENQKKKKD